MSRGDRGFALFLMVMLVVMTTLFYELFPRHGEQGPMGEGAACPVCQVAGRVRPDIVWFGEMPYDMERIDAALQKADLFVSIGTSGAVYPAAGFVQSARYCGAHCIEMNLEPSQGSIFFHETRLGRAKDLVPPWVEELLG